MLAVELIYPCWWRRWRYNPIYIHGARGCALIPLGPFFSIDAVQQNKQHGSYYSAPIRSYQTPVTPVREHGRERGGAILSRLSKMAVNMGDAAPPQCIRSYQALVTIVRGQTERRWSNFKPSKMAVNRTNKQHGRCYTAVMYPVIPNTSYPSERTQPWKRWSNFKPSE